MSKELRPYQIDSITAIENALSRGIKEHLLVLSCGMGKTFTAVKAIKDKGRALWIVTTEELAEQGGVALLAELELMPHENLIKIISDNGGLIELIRHKPKGTEIIYNQIGMIKADIFDIDKPIVVASAATLYRRLERIPFDYFKVIVCDEADLFASRTLKMPLDYLTYDLRLGLTGTPYRQDNLPLDDIFGDIIYEYPMQKAVQNGYLTKPIVVKVKTSTNLDEVHTLGGEFNTKELTQKINSPERNFSIVNKYLEYGQGRQFLAFCSSVEHAIDLCEAFKEKGVDCNYVVGDKELSPERKSVIDSFKGETTLGLTNVMVLTCGFDHVNIGVMIMACPTKSKRKFVQQVSRGMRLKTESFVSKFAQNVIILDVVDNTTKHKLINCDAIDAELDLEDKIFISDINREKLREAKIKREQMMNVIDRKEDEVFELFPLPKLKVVKSNRSNAPATPAHLKGIGKLGYNIESDTFTISQIQDIMTGQPAPQEEVEKLAMAGYDVSRGVSILEARLAYADMINKTKTKNHDKKKQY